MQNVSIVVLSRIRALENSQPQNVLPMNFHSKTEHKIKHNQIWLLWILGIGLARTVCMCPGSAWKK